MKQKIAVSWSGGKDACLALYHLLDSGKYSIDHLHTVIGEDTNRVGMHGIKKKLIEEQAKSLNIPLVVNYLPADQSNRSYEMVMNEYADYCKSKGITTIAFGDIFLKDLREYREKKMAEAGMKCIFPLWGKATLLVIKEFLELGYRTKICAGDASLLQKSIIGKTITEELLKEFDSSVDPCGENGEFHTFVFDGPHFKYPIKLDLKSIESHFYQYQIKKGQDIKKVKSEFYFAEFE